MKAMFPGIRARAALVLGALVLCSLGAQAQIDALGQAWMQRYNGAANQQDSASALASDPSGNVLIAGQAIVSSGQPADMVVGKYSGTGQRLWVATYNGGAGNESVASAIGSDALGNIYVAGSSGGDIVVLKYTPAGSRQWAMRYEDTSTGYSTPAGIAVDSAGNVTVAATTAQDSSRSSDILILRYSTSGVLNWVVRADGAAAGNDSAEAISLDSQGNVVVVGTSWGGDAGDFDIVVLKYSPTGAPLWNYRYNGIGIWDEARSLAVDPTGNIYVGGFTQGFWALLKFSPTGSLLWSLLEPAGTGEIADLALDGAGNVLVVGSEDYGQNPYSYDFGIAKYTAAGSRVWSRTYNGPNGGVDAAHDVAVDSAGSAYVSGYSSADLLDNRGEIAIVKYDQNGVALWNERFSPSGTGYVFPAGMVLFNDGSLVLGASTVGESTNSDDLVLTKYNQNGTLNLSISPSAANVGDTITGTISLIGSAPTGGATITLESTNPEAATVPATVFIPGGQASATFSVATFDVETDTAITFNASYLNQVSSANLLLRRTWVQSVTLDAFHVVGGDARLGTVTLVRPAPSGGIEVQLSSSSPITAGVPETVLVTEGETSETFVVTTAAVSADVPVLVTAAANGGSRSVPLLVRPPILQGVAVPNVVSSGSTVRGTIALNYNAPSGGLQVDLVSSNPAALSVPTSVLVPAGTNRLDFNASGLDVGQPTAVVVTASAQSVSRTADVTVMPELLSDLVIASPNIIGGNDLIATVVLTRPAPAGGLAITMTTLEPLLCEVSNVVVPEGLTAFDVSIPTNGVSELTGVTIMASEGRSTKAADGVLDAASLVMVNLDPRVVPAGTRSTGSAVLNGEAPPSGIVVSLASNNVAASVPATVTIGAGQRSATFPITTLSSRNANVTITANAGKGPVTAILTVTTLRISSLALSSTSTRGGVGAPRLTIRLSSNAPVGGMPIRLTSSDPAAYFDATNVTIPAGRNVLVVTVRTRSVTATKSVTLGAYLGSVGRTIRLSVTR